MHLCITQKNTDMAKKLLVKTPRTTDGSQIKYGKDRMPIFNHTFLPLTAQKHLESENARLEEHLRHSWQIVETEMAYDNSGRMVERVVGGSSEQEDSVPTAKKAAKPKGKAESEDPTEE